MGNFARAQGGTKRPGGRVANDYYPTPPFATYALVRSSVVPSTVWEPAAGRGWMANELIRCGCAVEATDLFKYDDPLCDVKAGPEFNFLTSGPLFDVEGVVTNPPYGRGLAQAFVEQAVCDYGYPYAAFLCRLSFAESKERLEMFRRMPPAEVHVFSGRISCDETYFEDPLRGMITFAWWVWRKNHAGSTEMKWIDTERMFENWKEDTGENYRSELYSKIHRHEAPREEVSGALLEGLAVDSPQGR